MSDRRIAIFGLGYVGLPLIRACLAAGHDVIGFDVSRDVVTRLLSGQSHVDDVSDAEVKSWQERGFQATSRTRDLVDVDVYVICVPTPLAADSSPDLGAVIAATTDIAGHLDLARRPLVILESTTYPGTTEEIVKPILETSGGVAGVDFALAFSPERIDPGNKVWSFENTPKVVGGLTESCADQAAAFYSTITSEVVRTKGLKEAEMAKLLENTYRHVNIALVNELAKISDLLGIDIWDVIAAAETKPYGFQAFRPGPGVGGHCIPIDPNYLGHRVRTELGQSVRFIELAQEINASMPEYVVDRVEHLLGSHEVPLAGAEVLLLGVTYKPNIADLRESPSYDVVRGLRARGASVVFHDSYVDSWLVDGTEVAKATDLRAAAAHASCTVLLQSHDEYLQADALVDSTLLLDTQGRLRSARGLNGTRWTTM
ncbi:MAG: nucleotide sugar dehydrogenase [Candidatus Nanopelagicales bacterium]|nr:nucleotide sugar dehydrogenase [Candidatus Nanopelagicales bacterium]